MWFRNITITPAFLNLLLFMLLSLEAYPQAHSSRRWGIDIEYVKGNALVMDEYQRKWMKGRENHTIGIRANYTTFSSSNDYFAADYNYPEISVGLRYSINNGVSMHREKDSNWPFIEPVDYDSKLGNIATLYGMFSRSLLRTSDWTVDYSLSFGVGYSKDKYNLHDAIDNELIGSRWLIYFGAGLNATYWFAPQFGVKAGVDFYHHSNGALNRPNKGANILGPSLGVRYRPNADEAARKPHTFFSPEFSRYWYLNITAGIGGKTMLEDWIETQFKTLPGEPYYRTDNFKFYAAYSLQADIMYRYARRWASGIGADLFYGSYSSHIKQLDNRNGHQLSHSPWSIGIAAKHQVYYKNASFAMSLGYYLFREMGHNASLNEKRYYERIGLHYTFPSLGGLTIGCNVKAHLTKADLTEFIISYPIRVGKLGR